MFPADLDRLLLTWTLGDKLQRLARLSPNDVTAIEEMVDDCLRHRWPTTTRFLKVVRSNAVIRKQSG